MKVFVYFNLRYKVWSIKALDGSLKGKVVAHATDVLLRDCEFRVSEAGRQRVLSERRKNVHAGVVGELESFQGDATPTGRKCFSIMFWSRTRFGGDDRAYRRYAKASGMAVTYNPYRAGTFTDRLLGLPVHRSAMVYMGLTGDKVFAFDPCQMPPSNPEFQ